MTEMIQFDKSSGSKWAARWVGVLAWLMLVSGAVNVAQSQSVASPALAQEQTSAQPLAVGQPVAREMRGGEEHRYEVKLSAGQYARVVVDQQGIDVKLALLGADDKPLLEIDNNLSGTRGLEIVSLVAEVSGAYRFKLSALEKDASAGRYEIRIQDLWAATEADHKRVAAERSYFIAARLLDQRANQSLNKVIESFGEALRLMREAGDRRGEAMTLSNIGFAYFLQWESQKALHQLAQALTVWRDVGDRHLEAITQSINGRVYYSMGEPHKALEAYNLALPVMRSVGDQTGEAITFLQIGNVYRLTGEPQKALDSYAQSLPLSRAVGDRRNEATVLNNMGTVYTLLGELQKALHYFDQAIPLARAKGATGVETAALTNMGHVYNLMDQPMKALGHLDQALTIAREKGQRRTEPAVLTHMGTAYSTLGDRRKAVEYFEQALKLRVAVSDRLGEATTLNHMGRAFNLWREPQKALEYYERGLPIWRAVGDRNGEVAALYGMARSDSKLDDLQRARTRNEAALAIINNLRTKVVSRDLRASYFASVQDIYKLHIDILMRLHRQQPAAGFDVAALKTYEQARARSLIDMLAESSADIRQGVEPQLLAREFSLQQRLNAEAERLRLFSAQLTEQQVRAALRKIEDLLTELHAVEAELKAQSPRYAALTQPAPLGLKEIQTAVTDDATLLLEYSLGEERSYLWAVTATSFSSYELPPRSQIEAAARRCYDLLTARNQFVKFEMADEKRQRVKQADAEYPEAASALSQMLFGPISAQLGTKRLLIVPDGALEYLPFAALPLPRQGGPRTDSTAYVPLMVDHEVTSIPSASTLAVLRSEFHGRTPAEKVVAVFADPVFDRADERFTGDSVRRAASRQRAAPLVGDTNILGDSDVVAAKSSDGSPALARLPYTRQEAQAILALVSPTGRKAALGFEANRAAAMSEDLSNYRIIHFATHSLLDSVHPPLSWMALSMLDRQGRPQEGFLRSHEVFNLKLSAELVVLSGCRTGLGKEVKGEGLYGMTRGFMYAGSKRVVVSLWDVQDQATARLMSEFYRGLLGPKRPPAAAALRAAQIATWRDERWSAPYYWAGFVLQGEPK